MARTRRKTIALVTVGLLATLGLVFALGPRPEVDLAAKAPALPEEAAALEAQLAADEARYPDLRPHAAKGIVWADAERKHKTDIAFVYIHGFSASRHEASPLCDILARRFGANVFYARLHGHGRSQDAMAEPKVNDWLHDGLEALAVGQRIGHRVVVIGNSLGGALGTWLATRPEARDLHALVLLAPALAPRDSRARMLLWPWGGYIARAILGSHRSFTPANELQDKHWTWRYPTESLVPMAALMHVAYDADVTRITRPVLLIYSERDLMVDPAVLGQRYQALGSRVKQRVVIDDSDDPYHHVLAGDAMAPGTTQRVADAIIGFVERL